VAEVNLLCNLAHLVVVLQVYNFPNSMKRANNPLTVFAVLAFAAFCFLAKSQGAAVDVSGAANVKPALPTIPERTFSLTDFGAVGDGRTLNTEAFKKAIAAVGKAGGGRLVVPKGIFRTLPFKLCSNLDLHLEEGAVIQAPDTFEALGLPDPATLKSQEEVAAKVHVPDPLITGRNLHDVALTGTGTIDGSGQHWWDWSERAARALAKTQPGRVVYKRPHLVVINGCERLHVADITLTNSSMFHLVPSNITDLTIERVKVRAPFDAPNTDAIDPGPGTNFLIRDCDIDTGDDDIVIKSGGTNILIENCTIKHGHGISIGSGTRNGFSHIVVRRCTFDGTDNGLRIKSYRGGGGEVHDIRYSDIVMKYVRRPFDINMLYNGNAGLPTDVGPRKAEAGQTENIPNFHDIHVTNLTVTGSPVAGRILGLPEQMANAIVFTNVKFQSTRGFLVQDGKVVGSRLIGQHTEDPKYFWGRLSATGFPTDAANSTGSNYAPSNPALKVAAQARIKALRDADPGNTLPVPVDI